MIELLDDAGRLAGQQVVERGVLGVDRDQPRAGGLGERGHELAADDQRLLVGQRDVDALGERDDRRAEAGGADDRVEHEVGAATRRRAGSGPRGRAAPRRRVHCSAARRGGVGVGERDPRHAVLAAPAGSAARGCGRRTGRRPRTRPGAREMTSSACVPMDPVEPRMRSRFTAAHCGSGSIWAR